MSDSNDHDLLIRIDQKVVNLTEEFRLMRDDTKDRVTTLEKSKAEARDFELFKKDTAIKFDQQEKRQRRLEKFQNILLGVVVALQVIIPIVLKYVTPH